jgi:hypothetical protein
LPAQALLDLEKNSNRVVLLDHHQTALEKLKGLKLERGLIHLDMNKSGARIAWEYFHGNEVIPAFIRFIEDRDLWRWRYPETRPFTANLDTEPMNFDRWSKILKMQGREFQEYIRTGEAMDEKFMHLARDIAKDAVPIVFNGESGLMTNAPATFHSMVGAILAERCNTFGLIWAIVGGQVKIGLRSVPDYNTLPLSHAMGGGGHENASAFRIPFSALPGLLSGTLNSEEPTAIGSSVDGDLGIDVAQAQKNKTFFHGMWSATSFAPHYEKSAWKSVHQQLIVSKLLG